MGRTIPHRRPRGGIPRPWPWALVLAALPGLLHAAELVLTPTQDNSIFAGGGYESRSDGAGDFLWLSVTAGGINLRCLVKFDTTSIPAGSIIRQVTLSLYESRARNEHVVRVHRLQRSWGESSSNGGGSGEGADAAPGDATWSHAFHPGVAWTQAGGDYLATASAQASVGTQGVFYSWGPNAALAADVQAWVNDASANHGWILIGDEQGLQNAKRFESRNNASSTNRPRLVVVYDPPEMGAGDVPLPAWALWAMGALMGGALVRRRGR